MKVGRPTRAADGSRWLPLLGLAWPGLPTDSGIFLSLAGPPAVGVVWTPGPGPWPVDPLVPAPGKALRPIESGDAGALPGLVGLADGWYVVEGTPADPERLVWIRCAACVDAGTKVWMRKGKGITAVERTTIAGPRTLTLTDGECTVPGLEIRLEVDPAPKRAP